MLLDFPKVIKDEVEIMMYRAKYHHYREWFPTKVFAGLVEALRHIYRERERLRLWYYKIQVS
jgi:hypothetical protein